jgi:hypothetical protein
VSVRTPDYNPVFGVGRMPTDEELRQMALDIIDTTALRLIARSAKLYSTRINHLKCPPLMALRRAK